MIRLISILIALLFAFQSFPQGEEKISFRKDELADIKNEIITLEKELASKSSKEKETSSALQNYSKQSFLLGKIISSLKAEEKSKETEIKRSEVRIEKLRKDLASLKENYAKYVVAIYKNGKVDELTSILNSESLQQAVLRYKYFQKFSSQREKDADKIIQSQNDLTAELKKLSFEKEEKANLALLKKQEESDLQKKLDERKKILASIKNDKEELKKELAAKKAAESQIKNLIAKLIEEEKIRLQKEAERTAKLEREKKTSVTKAGVEPLAESKSEKEIEKEKAYNLNLSTKNFSSFSALKGKMIWPILGGKILRRFGENTNSQLKTVTLNYGVDISAVNDLNVKAVGEGVVSAIDWIAGYGSVIIITHKDEYRTVYGHLSDIYVREGETVKMGKVIAKVGESIEGNILHFEIWNSRNNQNPETWLAKK